LCLVGQARRSIDYHDVSSWEILVRRWAPFWRHARNFQGITTSHVRGIQYKLIFFVVAVVVVGGGVGVVASHLLIFAVRNP
jgi:hypothetical protein